MATADWVLIDAGDIIVQKGRVIAGKVERLTVKALTFRSLTTFATDLAAAKWRLATGDEVDYNLTASSALVFTGLDVGDQFIVEPSLYRYSSGSQPRGASR